MYGPQIETAALLKQSAKPTPSPSQLLFCSSSLKQEKKKEKHIRPKVNHLSTERHIIILLHAAPIAQTGKFVSDGADVHGARGTLARLALVPAVVFAHARHVPTNEETFDFAVVGGVGGVRGGGEGEIVHFFGDVGGCVSGWEAEGEGEEGE